MMTKLMFLIFGNDKPQLNLRKLINKSQVKQPIRLPIKCREHALALKTDKTLY